MPEYPYVLRLRVGTREEKKEYHEDIYMVAKGNRIIRSFIECDSNGRLDEISPSGNWTWNYWDSKTGDVSFRTLNEKELEELSKREGNWKKLFD